MAIAAGVLTSYGIPSEVVLTPLAAAIAKHFQTKSSVDVGSSPAGNLDVSEHVPLVAKQYRRFVEQQKMKPR